MPGLLKKLKYKLSKPVFTVIIQDATARLSQGKLSPEVVDAFTGVAKFAGIQSGIIYGVRGDNGVQLDLSSELSPHHQAFRNAYLN